MARKKRILKNAAEKAARTEQEKQALQKHLSQIGMASIADYKSWCQDNGFSRSVRKSTHQRALEYSTAMDQANRARTTSARRQQRRADRAINDIFRGTVSTQSLCSPRLKALHRVVRDAADNRLARNAFERLLQHVQSCTSLFDERPALTSLGAIPSNSYIDALAALARHWRCWHRDVELWKPRTHNMRRQFTTLARHLLAEYDVPTFMDTAWFLGNSPDARKQQDWFIHIARGQNIRTADLPISYTKRMAHHFLKAPQSYTVSTALRWGQIHGLGGDSRLADAVQATRLGNRFDQDAFWVSVLRFFIANPMLDTVHVGPIIDYLHDQRFESHDVFVAPGVVERQPPAQPNLSMKGRDPDTLLRHVQRWHRQLAWDSEGGLQWAPSQIKGYEFLEGAKASNNMRRWKITELLSAKALSEEGRAMRHCVASYAGSCARRTTSIWSMNVETFEGRQRVLTIEVQLRAKLICQARGRFNERPNQKARNIMQRWAAEQGLTIAQHV